MRIGVGELRLYPDADPRSLPLSMRRRHVPIVRVLPGIGLMACWGLLVLLSMFMLFPPHLSKGFRIHLKEVTAAERASNPWNQTLGVYVADKDEFYVNGSRVAKAGLREKLREELGRQAVWVVYLEGDPKTKFENAVYAMGTIEDLGARVEWITQERRLR